MSRLRHTGLRRRALAQCVHASPGPNAKKLPEGIQCVVIERSSWLQGLDLAFAEHGAAAPRALQEPRAERRQIENRQLRSHRYRHEALGKRLRTAFKPDGGDAGRADIPPAGAFCPERTPRSSTAFGPDLPSGLGHLRRRRISRSCRSCSTQNARTPEVRCAD